MAEKVPGTILADPTVESQFTIKPFAAGLLSFSLSTAAGKAGRPTCFGGPPGGLDHDFKTATKNLNPERCATKDLFARTFREFSNWTYEEYYANFVERLPHRLLQAATKLNPELPSCRGFGELQDLFASTSGQRWKNPELYPFLNYINIPTNEIKIPTFLQSAVDALRIHAGLDPLKPVAQPPVKFWRLRDPTEGVFQDINGVLSKVPDVSLHEIEAEPFPIVYRPHPYLFDDVDRRLYRGDGGYHETKRLWRLAREAVQAISRYSPDLAAGFCREIGTVAFMDRQPSEFGSFSKRNFYIGGIFVSLAHPILVAEQFIHEYYHQCLWPWWMIEPPADLASDDQIIISPISGRARPLSSMIQGLLINYSLIDFYRFVLLTPESDYYEKNQLEDAGARLSKFEGGIGALLVAVKGALKERPHSGAIVEFIASTAAI